MIAALSKWHTNHEPAAAALEPVRALPAHVMLEAYAVLTRLPAGLAVSPTVAAEVLRERFGERVLRMEDADRDALLRTLSDAGVHGGASHDGIVALEAKRHGETLLTLDVRAQSTYRRLNAPFQVISA